MANGYMPRRDQLAMSWMRNFCKGLTQRTEVYGVSPAQLAQLQAGVDAFSAALRRATEPLTRTSPGVVAKDGARAQAERQCSILYNRIKPDPSISDGDKCAIGVRPVNRARRRIPVPDLAPQLQVAS